jgi:lysyl-tRNA synthetase class 1
MAQRRKMRPYRDFVKPTKKYRDATEEERAALTELRDVLVGLDKATSGSDIQTAVYEIGKTHECFADLRAWFKALYEILLGQEQGPRMGSFIALYGIDESVALIDRALAGEDLSA